MSEKKEPTPFRAPRRPVSFVVRGMNVSDLAKALDEQGIVVRAGTGVA